MPGGLEDWWVFSAKVLSDSKISSEITKTNSLPIEIHHFWWVWGVSNYHRAHHIIKFTQPISTMTRTYPKTPHEERFPSTATDASRRFLSGIKSSVGPESFLDLRSKFQENTMRCFFVGFLMPQMTNPFLLDKSWGSWYFSVKSQVKCQRHTPNHGP